MSSARLDSRKVVLITGASSGFGRLTALTLARQGHIVFASMRDATGRNAPAHTALREVAEREGLLLDVVALDVTDEASVSRAVDEVVERAGAIDVLVNNAGVVSMGFGEAFTTESAQRLFDVNVFGVLRATRAVLPHMRRQREGLVVSISSGVGRIVMPFMGLYSASKFAVEALAESTRMELESLGIDSVIVEPGAFPTPIFDKIGTPDDPERLADYGPLAEAPQQMAAALGEATEGMAADPQSVADAVAALVATPRGQRPLRTLVGEDVQGIQPLNDVAAEVQSAFLAQLGMGEESAQDAPNADRAALAAD